MSGLRRVSPRKPHTSVRHLRFSPFRKCAAQKFLDFFRIIFVFFFNVSLQLKLLNFGMPTKQQRLLHYANSIAKCPSETASYGTCVSTQAERIKQGDCGAEFEKLIECVTKNLKKP